MILHCKSIYFQVDENSFVPKVELNDDLETFTFSVPSLEAGKSLKLITPENFDINDVSFKIYSVVSANGDTALSQPINLNIDVFSDGSPADVSVSPSTAIEDGPAFDCHSPSHLRIIVKILPH